MLCVASVVFYASKDGAPRHPWVVGAFCGLWQADIYCPLTPGHDTEHPDSNEHMSVIPSSSVGLGEAQQESHNAKYGTEPHNCSPTLRENRDPILSLLRTYLVNTRRRTGTPGSQRHGILKGTR